MTLGDRSVRDYMLLEGIDDYVYASFVYSLAMETGAVLDENRRAIAVGAIAEVLAEGLMVAGDFVHGPWREWECSAAEASARIALQWSTVGNVNPLADEIVWLKSTEEGLRRARELFPDHV